MNPILDQLIRPTTRRKDNEKLTVYGRMKHSSALCICLDPNPAFLSKSVNYILHCRYPQLRNKDTLIKTIPTDVLFWLLSQVTWAISKKKGKKDIGAKHISDWEFVTKSVRFAINQGEGWRSGVWAAFSVHECSQRGYQRQSCIFSLLPVFWKCLQLIKYMTVQVQMWL